MKNMGDKGKGHDVYLRYPNFQGHACRSIIQANACILWKGWPLCLMAEANKIYDLKSKLSDPVNAVSPNPPNQ